MQSSQENFESKDKWRLGGEQDKMKHHFTTLDCVSPIDSLRNYFLHKGKTRFLPGNFS